VLSEKKFLNETKNITPPPLQVKWSVPNEEHFDNDHLEDCEYRYSLLNNIVQHTANESINTKFNEEHIHLSIGKLNTGKTSHGCTLTAEHFKYAGESIVPSIVKLFNKIIQSGKIPSLQDRNFNTDP
jgi:hypothetical protein